MAVQARDKKFPNARGQRPRGKLLDILPALHRTKYFPRIIRKDQSVL